MIKKLEEHLAKLRHYRAAAGEPGGVLRRFALKLSCHSGRGNSQRAQYPLIKEYSLNHIMKPYII